MTDHPSLWLSQPRRSSIEGMAKIRAIFRLKLVGVCLHRLPVSNICGYVAFGLLCIGIILHIILKYAKVTTERPNMDWEQDWDLR